MPKVPRRPEGMTRAYFGQNVMCWGSGDADADARISALRVQELREAGITADVAEEWRLFYLAVIEVAPENPSARGRARLMEHARTLLQEVH